MKGTHLQSSITALALRDRPSQPHRPRRARRWRLVALVVAGAVVSVGAVVVASFWDIDRQLRAANVVLDALSIFFARRLQ